MNDLGQVVILGLEPAEGPISLTVLRSFIQAEAAVYAHYRFAGNLDGQIAISGEKRTGVND